MKKTIFIGIILFAFVACDAQVDEGQIEVDEIPAVEEEVVSEPKTVEVEEKISWEKIDMGEGEYSPEINAYSGNEILRGWLEEVEIFGSEEKSLHFRVADEDLKNLPELYQGTSLYQIEEGMMQALLGYSSDNPATVVVTEIRSIWEGRPKMKMSAVK